jgi:5-(carboxyamino)imidazole ribonucleotide synthase
MVDRLEPILPGSYLGILGGGQLGRMFTQAAQAMGRNDFSLVSNAKLL